MEYEKARAERNLPAIKIDTPIELDATFDEPAWKDAPLASGFIQNDPRERQPATYDTEVACSTITTRSTSACSPRTPIPTPSSSTS